MINGSRYLIAMRHEKIYFSAILLKLLKIFDNFDNFFTGFLEFGSNMCPIHCERTYTHPTLSQPPFAFFSFDYFYSLFCVEHLQICQFVIEMF